MARYIHSLPSPIFHVRTDCQECCSLPFDHTSSCLCRFSRPGGFQSAEATPGSLGTCGHAIWLQNDGVEVTSCVFAGRGCAGDYVNGRMKHSSITFWQGCIVTRCFAPLGSYCWAPSSAEPGPTQREVSNTPISPRGRQTALPIVHPLFSQD